MQIEFGGAQSWSTMFRHRRLSTRRLGMGQLGVGHSSAAI